MTEPGRPTIDLIVPTVGRTNELEALFCSLERQSYDALRVLLVDQSEDDRFEAILARHSSLQIEHLRSERGLSRARNVALERVVADIVGFPDDDCVYPPGLLERVAEQLSADSDLDGLTGRAEDASGASSASWKPDAAVLTDHNLWNRAISFTIFIRRGVAERVGAFDERLGLGSPEPWSSGEEIDYLIRAVRTGARIEYDPSLIVQHDVRVDDARVGYRDGASVGYLLRKHRYPRRTMVRMLVRPAGGAAVSVARRDRPRASYYTATLRGRVLGLRRGRKSPK